MMKSSRPAIAIIPQEETVLIGTQNEQQLYSYSDSELAEVLQDPTTVKVFMDAVSDHQLLLKQGLEVKGQVFDVKLADSLLTAGLGMDNSYAAIGDPALPHHRHLGKPTADPNPEDLLSLRDLLREKLIEEQLVDVALVEFSATKVTAQMGQNGVRLDTAWLKDRQQKMQEERQRLDGEVKEWLGERIPDDVDAIHRAELTSTKRNDKAQTLEWFNQAGIPLENFNKNHIQELAVEHPILNQFQRMRSLDNLIGNKGIQGLLNAADDNHKAYPTWHQNAAATGRMSATNPPIQNIPSALKQAVIPEQDGQERQVFVRADYSQQELRILAQITGDKTLTEVYKEGRDAHRLTASLMTGKSESEVTDEERQRAKPVNFGKIYGQSAQGLQSYAKASYGVNFSLEDAQRFQAAMDKGYPGVAWHEQQVREEFTQQWREALPSEDAPNPQTRTLLGRKREWQTQTDQYPPVNEALNAPIQGSGADMSKLALALLPDALEGTGAKVTLVRHDEIVLTAPESQAEQAGKILERVMQKAGDKITPDVPTVAEVSICDNLAGERLSEQEFHDLEERLQQQATVHPQQPTNTIKPRLTLKSNPQENLFDKSHTFVGVNPQSAEKPAKSRPVLKSEGFDIRDHVQFRHGRGACPCCSAEGKPNNLNLSVSQNGLFWCFRGSGGEPPGKGIEQLHDEKAIRQALGLPEFGKVEANIEIREFNQSQSLAQTFAPKVATEGDLKKAQERLLSPHLKSPLQKKASDYLESRGISEEVAERYNIGLNFGFRTPEGRSLPAAITFYHQDVAEPDKLYARRRYAPWLPEDELEPGTPKWGQSGVPPSVWIVQQPEREDVEKTYLTEGPWDAIRLGEAVRQAGENIAVACTSTGARGIPPPEQLQAIPGDEVVIFYDRFDEHDEGQIGAQKMAKALREIGKQATVALVPHRGEVKKGWDVSDAFDARFDLQDFQRAEAEAKQQQRWAKQVAEVVCDCLNQARTHHLEGSKHTAHWDGGDGAAEPDHRLTLIENDSERKILDVVWDDGWTNVGSRLDQEKVDYFLWEIRPEVEQKYPIYPKEKRQAFR